MPTISGPRGRARRLFRLALALPLFLSLAGGAGAAPYLAVDLATGAVLAENQSFDPWYPASITKLMTVYVTLSAIKAGELKGDSGVVMTPASTREQPSKMGFKPGTVLTINTALRIIMVKSANDVSYALAERVGGGLPGFVARMNAAAARLGMTGTHFNNANGLPDPGQWTTARDYALLARALISEFPGYQELYRTTALSLGGKIIQNHNNLLERYPGSDGMKTGFICSSGFNVVATATRNGRRVLTIVLGGKTARERDELAANLLEASFRTPATAASVTLDRLTPRGPVATTVADMRDLACPKRKKGAKAPVGEDLGDGDDNQPASYLVPRFKVMDPIPISLGGASDMPDPVEPVVEAKADKPAVAVPLPLPKPAR
ncbi:D-alanyl-D-alanine carboxypeptidase family protein [Pleomorphomonas koreensis]|uniref:D-alanyl-D-alanine carboxypeptidase family protein n=1 Tax=Pleomorphomonas koreensis TaxID=257440 RepID=UPI0004254EB7|nr:D-alanyl-D-alanine carboxypeptidase family protein [Pleomorphomonas koreensis]